ncbi:hypothetical protein Enr13x_07250 [Stieleria neptunia]|uniref:Uncharacterized protein n=1 Tax=Stieleria neptunia TaxID=2527979 RepID=A0A518HJA3_9BACT|nr:hypothetical protein [Stieleria neptunia]QDV40889.1 hypothetical protein Enr13x_07250 [Stieleria neptunia]
MPKPVLTVARHPGKKQPFHRAVRDKRGKVKKVITFDPDQPVGLSSEEAELVKRDIGRALVIIEADEKRPGRFIVDWETTRGVFHTIHKQELEVSPRARRAIGASETPPPSVMDLRGDEAGKDADAVSIELPDELVDLLERNGDSLPSPLSAESLTQWIGDGGELVLLDGFTVDSAAAVHAALGLDAPVQETDDGGDVDPGDKSKLLGAGLSPELAEALAKNAEEHPWVMDPEQLKVKVADGFDLTQLTDIAGGRAKQIRTALGVAAK